MLKKKRNNSIIGWRKDVSEILNYLDVEHNVTSSKYYRRLYLTILSREFKVYDFTFTRDSKITEKEIDKVGFKK